MDLRLEPLTKEREADFLALMARDEHGGQCWCVAWWVPTWESYIGQTPEEHRTVRDDLFATGVHDGYLAYADGAPVGWVQAGPRDDLPKIAETFSLAPGPGRVGDQLLHGAGAVPRQGLGRRIFTAALDDIRSRGASAVEGYPLHGTGHEAEDVWTGPESLYLAAGFTEVSRGPRGWSTASTSAPDAPRRPQR